ncbi:pentapeptide repeat-containing protein [Eubacterium multiforme]|uniref:Uncharacterized protein YjbI with pentapeptide repeats n=1 Tax=Eubacterium multiforme TaxID=83339 RepID=A0ABT9UTK7_9FIRM|nr:pentapeptide repeat-containing protein [Eubacterium multiforme]MDQ0149637.1 uncharacterized protein YjbI with pentapeptide repeats [Eubacterium multiforme]
MSKEIKQREINKMARDHEEWIDTNGKSGKKLNLEGKELNGIRLLNLNLKEANFKNTIIKDTAIFANLEGANFEGSKIDNVEFIGSNIKGMKIDTKELERINIQIKEELSLHNEANVSLKTNNNKEKSNDYELKM